MKVIWLGQAGFLLEQKGKRILIDPYLSDSCALSNPNSYRRTPIDDAYLKIRPDVILLTHEHKDHMDMQTLSHYLPGNGGVLVLAAANAWDKVRTLGGDNNYVMFRPGTQWSWEGITFTAVPAEHSDRESIGVVVDDGKRKYYFTGDTLYNERIFSHLPGDLYAVFLPINGRGNNMNPEDAGQFAERTGAIYSVPIHFGMFDSVDPAVFSAKNSVIPRAYAPVFEEDKE